jgi:mannose-6-phosphate isomerase-like protein (cupin superfamily)
MAALMTFVTPNPANSSLLESLPISYREIKRYESKEKHMRAFPFCDISTSCKRGNAVSLLPLAIATGLQLVLTKEGTGKASRRAIELHLVYVALAFMPALLAFFLLIAPSLSAQDRTIDPTWLHRYVPELHESKSEIATPTCHYKAIFGEGDSKSATLRSVSRFGEATLDPRGNCRDSLYPREEELYFVLQGQGTLHYAGQTLPLRANDFTYLAPGAKHSLANTSDQPFRVLVMGFKIPSSTSIDAPPPQPKIVNMDTLKEETVGGHPTSVLYKLLIGPRKATRDAIDDAYVVTSLFWMDFAPGGTNFPHHHETAEEIYLVVDGQGEMVAGSGSNGIEGRYPAKPGDAYYFRPNCTVGFYNENKPGAKAHILAVRSRIPLPKEDD